MENKKRVLFLFIVLLMISLSVFANGQTDGDATDTSTVKVNKTGWPIVDEKITIEMLGGRAQNQVDWNEMAIWKYYAAKTNVNVNWTTIDLENIDEKLPLLIASGNYPEVLYGLNLKDYEEIKWASQGILIPIEDYIAAYAPNIQDYLDSHPEVRKTYTAPDGHMYTIPVDTDRTVFMNAYTSINVKWLDALGLDMPQTADEFYDVLKAFGTQDPNGNGKADEIPLCLDLKGSSDSFWYILEWFGITALKDSRVFVEDDGTVRYVPTDERFLEALKWLNTLWEENLLDHEAFTQTWLEINGKCQSPEAEVVGAFERNTIAWTVGFDRNDDYEIMPALENYTGTKMVTGRLASKKGLFSLTNNCTHPEVILRWVDYFQTAAGSLDMQHGPQGMIWEWVDESKGAWTKIQVETDSMAESITPRNGTSVPYMNYDSLIRNRVFEEGEIDWMGKVYDAIDESLHPYRRVPFPNAYMSADQVNQLTSLKADLDAYVDQMFARFIVGAEPFSNWDDYVNTAHNIGADELVSIYQDVYDAYDQ